MKIEYNVGLHFPRATRIHAGACTLSDHILDRISDKVKRATHSTLQWFLLNNKIQDDQAWQMRSFGRWDGDMIFIHFTASIQGW